MKNIGRSLLAFVSNTGAHLYKNKDTLRCNKHKIQLKTLNC